MMRSLLQLQAAGEQQFAQEEERILRSEDVRLAGGSTGAGSAAEASEILAENRRLVQEQKEEQLRLQREEERKAEASRAVGKMAAHTQKNNKPRKPAGKESSQHLIIAKTPEFVRDVMGSGAGAGSGEFHVFRRLRRGEYQGRDFLDRMSGKVNEDIECLNEVELSKQAVGDGAAGRGRKRKRLRRKIRMAKIAEKVRQERERVREQNQIPKRKKGKLPSDYTPAPEETKLHKGKQKPREAKIFKTLFFQGRGVRKCHGGNLWAHRSRPPLRVV
nr:PRKR-interacting protein 1 homolog [Pseudochaenichthys georgianus]